jgi:DNA-binding CsgD family transcriptional regulator
MLEVLGLEPDAEAVYRKILEDPRAGVEEIGARLSCSIHRVRDALDELARLSLLRPSWDDPGGMRLVSPEVGLSSLLAHQEADLAEKQRQIAASRSAVATMVADYATLHPGRQHAEAEHLIGLDAVRGKLEALAHAGIGEVMAFATGGAQTPANLAASRSLDREALERGTAIRTVYLDSVRNDSATLDYLRWLDELGAQIRTAATLPLRMTVFDRKMALIPVNPDRSEVGAVIQHGAGVVTAMCALFEQTWLTATPLGETRARGEDGLTNQEREIIALLGQGHTDEVIARRLGVSVRTSRRITADLMIRLGARSRFQAGAHATQQGWL